MFLSNIGSISLKIQCEPLSWCSEIHPTDFPVDLQHMMAHLPSTTSTVVFVKASKKKKNTYAASFYQ